MNMNADTRPWFRIGALGVTTALLAVGVGIVGIVLAAIAPMLLWQLSLGSHVELGLWRVITWPFISPVSVWAAINLFFLWYFGKEIENEIGRVGMAWLFGGVWLSLTVATVLTSFVFPGVVLAGLGLVGFIVMILFIANDPQRPFFGGIPAWGVSIIFIALYLLQYLQARSFGAIVVLLLGLLGSLVAARWCGYLLGAGWLPVKTRKTEVQKTWEKSAKQARQAQAEQQRMDFLLDKISTSGLDSLTSRERKELKDLGEKRRARRG